MSLTLWGALLGAVAAGGLLLVVSRVLVIRKPQLAVRVLPYVRDLPQVGRPPDLRTPPSGSAWAVEHREDACASADPRSRRRCVRAAGPGPRLIRRPIP